MNKKIILGGTLTAITIALAALSGCGGSGGSGGGTTTTGTSGRATVLITDSFREDYAHVYATIYHVELVSSTGSTVILFDDPTGRQIDLKTLRDASGARFSFLGTATIPAGTYTGINVTIGATMQLFKTGSTTGTTVPVDTTIATDTNGHPVLKLTFAKAKTITATTTNLVVDFDLARFVIRSSNVLPALAEGTSTGLTDPNRHNCDDYHGTVSDLTGTAPTLTFVLNRGNGQTVTVTTTASTTLYGSTTLANGSIVDVRGTLDTTTQTLVATEVATRPASDGATENAGKGAPNILATASNLLPADGKFTATLIDARCFTPTKTTVTVVTNTSTVFRADNGTTLTSAEFFTALATTPQVQAEGTYDATTNTLTATSVKIVDTTQDGGWENTGHSFRKGKDKANWGNGVL